MSDKRSQTHQTSQKNSDSIESLLSSRELFDSYVYTSIEKALFQLEERKNDEYLTEKISVFLGESKLPDPLAEEQKLVLFRQLASPNYEMSRFLITADAIGIKPLFFEYFEDKFTSNNHWKKYLGKLAFHEGFGKKGGTKVSYQTIVDFNKYNGKKISDVQTMFGDSLIDFHHKLFGICHDHVIDENFYDASEWFKKNGGRAHSYYEKLLTLFLQNGILFENFVLTDPDEHQFTKEVFLPAFQKILTLFDIKPLIVALEPTEVEGDEFWLCHNKEVKQYVEIKNSKLTPQ